MSKLKFGNTRTGDTIRSERTASVEPIIRIVRPNALERIQISGLDIKVSGGERDFRATCRVKSAVYRDPPLGRFRLHRDVSKLRKVNTGMMMRSKLVDGRM